MVIPRNVRKRVPSTLRPIFQNFPNLREACDVHKAEVEWRLLSLISLGELGLQTEDELNILPVERFWALVLDLKCPSGLMFPNLAVVVTFLFSMPHSNAIAERVFSFLKLNRSDRRNCLSNEVFLGLMRTKYMLKNAKSTFASISFPQYLVDRVLRVRANQFLKEDVTNHNSCNRVPYGLRTPLSTISPSKRQLSIVC